ncbi:hypothetical protein [Deinococcus sonorensis]|uniref:Uncharacterized protein n=2 Tax=Deinococcus sonorensis TaxID=309891 RepID=A0AAU7U686_9DEIO
MMKACWIVLLGLGMAFATTPAPTADLPFGLALQQVQEIVGPSHLKRVGDDPYFQRFLLSVTPTDTQPFSEFQLDVVGRNAVSCSGRASTPYIALSSDSREITSVFEAARVYFLPYGEAAVTSEIARAADLDRGRLESFVPADSQGTMIRPPFDWSRGDTPGAGLMFYLISSQASSKHTYRVNAMYQSSDPACP